MWLHILSHIGLAVFQGLDRAQNPAKYQRRDKNAGWVVFIAAAVLVGLCARLIVSWRESRTDILSGRAAVEGYLRANVTAFVVIFVLFMVYVILAFRSLSRDRGADRIILVLAAGAIVVFFGIRFGMSSHRINEDLREPRSVTVSEYVLCKQGGNYYIAFEDKGEYPLLAVPYEEYVSLSAGSKKQDRAMSRVYLLVADGEYSSYESPELYGSPVTVEYYFNSAIYLSASLGQRG